MLRMCEPEIGNHERKYVIEALDENMLSGHGRHVKLFEERFAEKMGVDYAIMVPNGSIALNLAFAAIGLEEGQEICLPSQTISCCAHAISQRQGVVVPVDVDRKTWTMDPEDLESAISEKTVAVVPTGIFAGILPDMNSIREVVKKCEDKLGHKIYIIEDFAESIGSHYGNEPSGSLGEMGCCSLFSNKNITTGEGGMVTTSNADLNKKLRYLRNNAFGDGEMKFWADDMGYNYRPQNLVACLGLGQLDHFEHLMQRRIEIHSFYKKYLAEEYVWQENTMSCKNIPWMNAVLVPKKKEYSRKSEFIQYMKENDVETRPLFPPIGQHPYLLKKKDLVRSRLEVVSEELWENGVLLPSGGITIQEESIKHICELTNNFLKVK